MTKGPTKSALMTQAEFARANGVSRKTVTQWKKEGRVVLRGNMIDVKASHLRLGRRSRLGQQTKIEHSPPQVMAPVRADHAPEEAILWSIAIDSAVADLPEFLLPLLPSGKVRELCERFTARWRAGAIECLEEDEIALPRGVARWEDWKEFTSPPLSESEWQEMIQAFARR